MNTSILGEIALDLLMTGQHFTDIHVESGMPIMLRCAAGDWMAAMDANGETIMATHSDIVVFLNGLYNGTHTERPPQSPLTSWEKEFKERGSLHPATTLSRVLGDGTVSSVRVRCTVQKQSMGDAIGLVMRPLKEVPKSVQSLGLPLQLSRMLQDANSGLLVMTGPTGSGKSTTLAAMVNELNETRSANILTIEDPVEFVHDRKKSIINQREVSTDVVNFEAGVRDALRFVPDVILIGEIRDSATMRAALRAGESGHLVLTSMHAPTTVSALRKMFSYLADSQAESQALAGCLVGIVAHALIRGKDNTQGNHLAYELLNAREPAVMAAIASGASDVTGGTVLAQLEEKVRLGESGAMPMMRSVRDLVSKGLVDSRRAAAALVNSNEKAEMLRSMPQ